MYVEFANEVPKLIGQCKMLRLKIFLFYENEFHALGPDTDYTPHKKGVMKLFDQKMDDLHTPLPTS